MKEKLAPRCAREVVHVARFVAKLFELLLDSLLGRITLWPMVVGECDKVSLSFNSACLETAIFNPVDFILKRFVLLMEKERETGRRKKVRLSSLMPEKHIGQGHHMSRTWPVQFPRKRARH